MEQEVIWSLKDRASLERRFQLVFAGCDRREWAAKVLVRKFIDDVSMYPVDWPISAELNSIEEWRFRGIRVLFMWHPEDQLIEVLEIHADQKAEPSASPNGGPATPVGNSGAAEGPPSVS
jgi:hypothetical protein